MRYLLAIGVLLLTINANHSRGVSICRAFDILEAVTIQGMADNVLRFCSEIKDDAAYTMKRLLEEGFTPYRRVYVNKQWDDVVENEVHTTYASMNFNTQVTGGLSILFKKNGRTIEVGLNTRGSEPMTLAIWS